MGTETRKRDEQNGKGAAGKLLKNGNSGRDDTELTTFQQPDGGWGWVVCLTSLCTNGTVFGSINTFGILYVAMKDEFGGGDTNIAFKTAWVGSVCTGLTFFTCMAASILSDRIGIRKVAFTGGLLAFVGMLSSAFVEHLMLYYVTYGVLMGIGFSLAYSPSLVILGHYFKKRMGLVNGLVTFGSAVFTITYSLVLPLLLQEIGLKNSLLCLSGMIFLLMPYSLTWKPLIVHDSNLAALMLSTESVVEHLNDCCRWTRKFLNVRIWRNRGYVVWALANGVSLFGYFIPFVHLVQHTRDVFPGADGNLLPMFISITSGVSRIFFGLMSDCKCLSRVHMQQMAFLLLGVTTMCIPFADSFEALVVICLVMGLCDGLFICLLGPIAFDLVGETGASQALGFLFGIFSFPMTVGPPLAGLSYDYLGSYRVAFHAAGAPPIIGAILMFLIPRHQERHPAVTDIEEFVGVSCPDIYSSRMMSTTDNSARSRAPEQTATNGGPSKTEMITISDPDAYNRLTAEGFLTSNAMSTLQTGVDDVDGAEETKMFLDKASEHSDTNKRVMVEDVEEGGVVEDEVNLKMTDETKMIPEEKSGSNPEGSVTGVKQQEKGMEKEAQEKMEDDAEEEGEGVGLVKKET